MGGKFQDILIGTDLDGTLLDNEGRMSDENKDALRYFMSEGGRFTYMTGRTEKGFQGVLREFMPNAPVGCLNGGGIYDFSIEKWIWTHPIDRSVLEVTRKVMDRFPEVGFVARGYGSSWYCRDNEYTLLHRSIEGMEDRPCIPAEEIPEAFSNLLFAAREDRIEAFDRAVRKESGAERFAFMRSHKNFVEALPCDTNKGVMLLRLAELLGIPKERTIGVGDNENDAAMLRMAQVGIAVENAYPTAKAAADRITVSNEEHALARIIDDLENRRIQI